MQRVFVLRDEIAFRRLGAFLRANWLAMARAGKPLGVTVSEYKAQRSGAQNRKYWAVLREIADSAWVDGKRFSEDAWHDYYKRRFIGTEEAPDGGSVGISTTTLDVEEFSVYIEKVMQHASEQLGIEISG